MSGATELSPSTDLRVDLLGPLRVTRAGADVTIPGRRERATLALLASEVGRPVVLSRLYALLWGDSPPRTADKTLQTYVSRLRSALGDGGLLARTGNAYTMQLASEHVDVARFDRARDAGAEALRRRDPEAARTAFEEALAQWRADEPAEVGDTTAARGWRHALTAARLDVVEGLAGARLALGQGRGLASDLERELARRPDREALWALLMEAHAASGDRAAALDAYRRARVSMVEELGLDPSPALTRLHARILRGQPVRPRSSTTAGTAGDRDPAGTGSTPAPTPTAAPTPPAAPTPTAPPTPTPTAAPTTDAEPLARPRPPPALLAPLIGRSTELDALRAVLGEHRLVTLTGPGGVGKTRLAAEMAHQWTGASRAWCDLVPLPPGAPVDRTILGAFGLTPGPEDDHLALASTLLGDAAVLLVLDNAEHVLDPVRTAVARLLSTCPGLTVLVTTRTPLRIAGERVTPVRPLSTEPSGDAQRLLADAVERAGGPRAAPGADDLLTDVCRRLDGLPLALELAAPLVCAAGLVGVRDGLDDRFGLLDAAWDASGRRRDLAQAVAWSESLLPDRLRDRFRSLSVFAGPFDVDDVAAVSGDPASGVRRELAALADRSLIEPVGEPNDERPRFRLLETLRDYGRRTLDEQALGRLRDRHAAWVAGLADDMHERFLSSEEARLRRVLDDHLDEVEAAVRWSVERRDHATSLRIALGLGYPMFTGLRGDLAGWIEQVAAAADGSSDPRLSGAWGFVALWRFFVGDRAGADAAAESAVHAARAAGGPLPASLWHYRVSALLAAYELEDAYVAVADATAAGLPEGPRLAMESSMLPLELSLGRRQEARLRDERLLPRIEANGSFTLRAIASMPADPASVGPGAAATALSDMRAGLDLARAAGSRLAERLLLMVIGQIAVASGDDRAAVAAFLDILGSWGVQGTWRYEWNTIRLAVEVLARVGDDEAVLVLDAAAAHSPHAPEPLGEQAATLSALRVTARERLEPAARDAAVRRGDAMGDAAAVAFTRTRLRRLAN